jgi:hypothetical protein
MKKYIILSSLFIVFFSCKKDDPFIPNEEELITTIKYMLVPEGSNTPVTMLFRDSDGPGGNSPEIMPDTVIFDIGTVYSGTLELLNELENPAINISEEIEEEAEHHQFFFVTTDGLDLSIDYDDNDKYGNPVGLKTIVRTGSVSSGKITITLRHEPDKFATGAADGDISNAGGETDIEVSFNVRIR